MQQPVFRLHALQKPAQQGGNTMLVDQPHVIDDNLCFLDRFPLSRIDAANAQHADIMRIDRRCKLGEIALKAL